MSEKKIKSSRPEESSEDPFMLPLPLTKQESLESTAYMGTPELAEPPRWAPRIKSSRQQPIRLASPEMAKEGTTCKTEDPLDNAQILAYESSPELEEPPRRVPTLSVVASQRSPTYNSADSEETLRSMPGAGGLETLQVDAPLVPTAQHRPAEVGRVTSHDSRERRDTHIEESQRFNTAAGEHCGTALDGIALVADPTMLEKPVVPDEEAANLAGDRPMHDTESTEHNTLADGSRVRGSQTEDDFIRSCIPDFAKTAFGISMHNEPTFQPYESTKAFDDEFSSYMANGISFSQLPLTQFAAAAQASQTSSAAQRQIKMAAHYNELQSACDEDTLQDHKAEEEEQSVSRSGFVSPPPAVPAPPAVAYAATTQAAKRPSPAGEPIFALPDIPASIGSTADDGIAPGQGAAAVMWSSTTPRNSNAPALYAFAAPQSGLKAMQPIREIVPISAAVLPDVKSISAVKEFTATPPSKHGGQACLPLCSLYSDDHPSVGGSSEATTQAVVARVAARTSSLELKETISRDDSALSTDGTRSEAHVPCDTAASLTSVSTSPSGPATSAIGASDTVAGAPSSCFASSSSPDSSPTTSASITRRGEATSTPPSSTLPSSSPPKEVSGKRTAVPSHPLPIQKPSHSEHPPPKSAALDSSLPPPSDADQAEGPRVTSAQAGSVLISSLKMHTKFMEFLAEEAESHTIADLFEAGMTSRDMVSIVEACAKEHNIRIVPRTLAGNRLREALEVYEKAREHGW